MLRLTTIIMEKQTLCPARMIHTLRFGLAFEHFGSMPPRTHGLPFRGNMKRSKITNGQRQGVRILSAVHTYVWFYVLILPVPHHTIRVVTHTSILTVRTSVRFFFRRAFSGVRLNLGYIPVRTRT